MRSSWPASSGAAKRPLQDYNRRKYANPLFPQGGGKQRNAKNAARRQPSPYGRLALLVLGGVALVGAVGAAVYGPFLRITDVTVAGASAPTERRLRAILDEQLESRRALLLPQSNVLAFGTSAALRRIGAEYSFASVTLARRLPHGLDLVVSEREPVAAVAEDGKLLVVDKEGVAIREFTKDELDQTPHLPDGVESVDSPQLGVEAFEVSGTGTRAAPKAVKNLFPLITGVGAAKPGKEAIDPETLALVLTMDARLRDVTGEIPLWYKVDEDTQSVDVAMEKGWHGYWSALLSYQEQADRLAVALREKVGDRRGELISIDLRYGEKLFLHMAKDDEKK
jgi:hypothetical protein